ncbi:MAG: phage shock protein operon transcriptional activator [Legionellales bacterium]|nr:phage shock protein operon transcriptional activator [Legionellales bacterium]
MTNQDKQLIGVSKYFQAMLDDISKLAPLDKPVLLIGERGSGKEMIAERLHYLSSRWQAPFIKLNCATLVDTLLESELFGHEAGSFTGASKRHHGRFELAHHGSIFLDEIATMSPRLQEKLLRVIEYGEFERVGGTETLTTDTRIIAATNVDLPNLCLENKFRADLLDRLAFAVITLPPLRAREEDILLLSEHFAINMATNLGWEFFPGFSETVKQQLLEYSWPGNVRELKNVIERAVFYAENSQKIIQTIIFDPFDSPFRPQATVTPSATIPAQPTVLPSSLKNHLQQIEAEIIINALAQHHFHQGKAAHALGLTYHQLRALLRKHNIKFSTHHS